jgi:hypothetical protein
MKLNIKGFALTVGICWGAAAFLLTLLSLLHGTGEHLKLLGLVFFGYQVSYLGSIMGLVYGFVEGFASGALFAWLYNRLTD